MGFLGSIRKIVLRTSKGAGKFDLIKASEDLVKEAKRTVNTADISGFFTTKFLREVNGTAKLGEQDLFAFVRFSREGNYAQSFATAFPRNASLNNPAVRLTVTNLLLDARRTLPDFHIAQNADLLTSAKKVTGLETKGVNTVGDLEKAVASNNKIAQGTESLIKRAIKSRTFKVFAYTVVLGAGVVTAQVIFEKLVELAKTQSGCFAYWTDNTGAVQKCKISSYSCLNGSKGEPCTAGVIPSEIIANEDCSKSENKDRNCIHCANDDPLNVSVPDNITLRCEEHTAGDFLLDAITNTVGNIWTGITSGVQNIIIWGVVILVIIVVIVIVINVLR